MIKKSIFIALCAFVLVGCSSKSQIAPDGGEYEVSGQEKNFKAKQELNKKINDAFKQGQSAGYGEAKAEFEKIIPYIEAIRASAELKESGGLCLPPLFLDKSNQSRVAVVLGEAHVCENFTVENVLAAVKHGIPGLPKTESSAANGQNKSESDGVSSVVLAGADTRDFFIEDTTKVKQRVKATIADTFTNREVLRTSNFSYAKSEIGDKNSLIVEFVSEAEAKAFCEKYSICKEGVEK